MSERTAIEWTDATANFWRGCDKVSPGCAHCYMFTAQRRYGRDPSSVVRASPGTFRAPLSRKWQQRAVEIAERDGRRMRVFICSWSDFLHEAADPWRDDAWEIIRACPQYDWQILTKRPELAAERLPADWGDGWPHVWLGVSIENRRFVARAEQLRRTPAAVRFISAEPLLGPLCCPTRTWPDGYTGPSLSLTGIDWLIVGLESGPGHRPIRPEWVRELRDHCLAGERTPDCALCGEHSDTQANPRFFFKQWGGALPTTGGRELDGRIWGEFPPSLGPGDVSAAAGVLSLRPARRAHRDHGGVARARA